MRPDPSSLPNLAWRLFHIRAKFASSKAVSRRHSKESAHSMHTILTLVTATCMAGPSAHKIAHMQITALEKNGGTILGGAIKLLRDRKKNPGPPRDPSLPPKPKGQTVGSFTGGLRMLPEAIASKMQGKIRSFSIPVVNLTSLSHTKVFNTC